MPLYWLAYQEAFTCLEGSAFRALAVMCRLSLCEALLARGVEDGETAAMINAAIRQGLLKGRCRHLALTVGFFGGKAAHPHDDPIYRVGQTEAIQDLRVLRELLLMLFPAIDPDDLPFE